MNPAPSPLFVAVFFLFFFFSQYDGVTASSVDVNATILSILMVRQRVRCKGVTVSASPLLIRHGGSFRSVSSAYVCVLLAFVFAFSVVTR